MYYYLYLVRHAQSADKQIGQTDKERAITPVGLEQAKAVGNFLKEKSIIPELIISSSALRANTTAQTLAEILPYRLDRIILKDDLYDANVSDLLQIVSRISVDINKVMVVGHNPGISLLVDHLTKEQNRNLFPSELVVIKFEFSNWLDIDRTVGRLEERYHKFNE